MRSERGLSMLNHCLMLDTFV